MPTQLARNITNPRGGTEKTQTSNRSVDAKLAPMGSSPEWFPESFGGPFREPFPNLILNVVDMRPRSCSGKVPGLLPEPKTAAKALVHPVRDRPSNTTWEVEL